MNFTVHSSSPRNQSELCESCVHLQRSCGVIIEVAVSQPEALFQLGFAYALGLPTLTLVAKDHHATMPIDIRNIDCVTFERSNPQTLEEPVTRFLSELAPETPEGLQRGEIHGEARYLFILGFSLTAYFETVLLLDYYTPSPDSDLKIFDKNFVRSVLVSLECPGPILAKFDVAFKTLALGEEIEGEAIERQSTAFVAIHSWLTNKYDPLSYSHFALGSLLHSLFWFASMVQIGIDPEPFRQHWQQQSKSISLQLDAFEAVARVIAETKGLLARFSDFSSDSAAAIMVEVKRICREYDYA